MRWVGPEPSLEGTPERYVDGTFRCAVAGGQGARERVLSGPEVRGMAGSADEVT